MLKLFVHTPLAHSVLMSLTVLQAEPKPSVPCPPGASGDGLLPLLHATIAQP
jgi:hypothetical protein